MYNYSSSLGCYVSYTFFYFAFYALILHPSFEREDHYGSNMSLSYLNLLYENWFCQAIFSRVIRNLDQKIFCIIFQTWLCLLGKKMHGSSSIQTHISNIRLEVMSYLCTPLLTYRHFLIKCQRQGFLLSIVLRRYRERIFLHKTHLLNKMNGFWN